MCLFLRKISSVSLEFYHRFQEELMLLFEEYTILIEPPLKLDSSGAAYDAALNVNNFLGHKVYNFRKLLRHSDFKGQFSLKLHLRVESFDLERD